MRITAGGRLAGAAIAGLLLAGAAAFAPHALAVTVSTETTPQVIVYYGPDAQRTTRQLVHRLHLQTGPSDERLWLDISEASGNTRWEGQFAPWSASRDVVLEGAGHLSAFTSPTGISATTYDPIAHTGRDRCPAPVSTRTGYRSELTLPADSSSTILFTRRLALTHAPTDASLYVQDWSLTPLAASGAAEGLRVRVPGVVPTFAGLEPARLELRAGVTGTVRSVTAGQRLAVRTGQDLTLSGSLAPAERGERITLWRYSRSASKPTQVAVVRVDRFGRFIHRHWRPPGTGLHELYATYAGRSEIVEPTRSGCGGPKIKVNGAGKRSKPARPA